jgi:hypothetical protein
MRHLNFYVIICTFYFYEPIYSKKSVINCTYYSLNKNYVGAVNSDMYAASFAPLTLTVLLEPQDTKVIPV